MSKRLIALAAAAVSLATAVPASAQLVGQQASEGAMELGQCVVGVTTGNDRVLVAQWVGSSLAMAPQLERMVTVDAAAKDALDRRMADLFFRLFTQDCVDYARPLVQRGDQVSIQAAFGMLGEVAMQELLTDPRAMAAMTSYIQHIPLDRFMAAMAK